MATIRIVECPSDYPSRERGNVKGGPLSYPWLTVTKPVLPTPEAAQAQAEAWLKAYIAGASWARMGHVVGVAVREGGYVGVVNYYHSNS